MGGSNSTHAHSIYLICMCFIRINAVCNKWVDSCLWWKPWAASCSTKEKFSEKSTVTKSCPGCEPAFNCCHAMKEWGSRTSYFSQSKSTKSSADWLMVSRVDMSTETQCLYTILSIRLSSIRESRQCFGPDISGREQHVTIRLWWIADYLCQAVIIWFQWHILICCKISNFFTQHHYLNILVDCTALAKLQCFGCSSANLEKRILSVRNFSLSSWWTSLNISLFWTCACFAFCLTETKSFFFLPGSIWLTS